MYENWDLLSQVKDSKVLSKKKREGLAQAIRTSSIETRVEVMSAAEVDRLNPLRATMFAMSRGISQIREQVDPFSDPLILIDGSEMPQFPWPARVECLVKGDSISCSIACASIIAKVFRDNLMTELDLKYPGYGLAKHMGYGTKQHNEALLRLGPCPEHRRTFSVAGRKIGELLPTPV
jgi:ribonuclease HII